ncbi:MAG: hypothetical protein JXJ04_11225, partial [Spirochaetales bacterium]|nr:hypothetical protein [Spirochaetales bacterium]
MAQPAIVNQEINSGSVLQDRHLRWSVRIHTFFIFLIVIIVPVIAKLVLNAGVPFYIIIGIVSGKLIIEKIILLKIHPQVKKILWIVSTLFSGLFALLLLVSVIITPHSIYVFFFEVVKNNGLGEEYFVANLFVMITVFFSFFFGSASLKQNSFKPLLGLLSILCGLFLIIYQSALFALLLFISLIIYIAMLLKKRAFYFISIIVLASFFSLIFFMINPQPEGSRLVDDFLFPQTRLWINT